MQHTILFSVLVLTIFSCSKKNDESKTGLLTEKPWKWIKIESKVNNDPWDEEVQYWPSCRKDDEMLFKRDHSYVFSNGATKCNFSDPDILDEATWSFLENETKIDIDGSVTKIEVIDHNQLILSETETFGGDTYYYRYTLSH